MRRRKAVVFTAIVLGAALAACSVITGLNADYTTRTDNDDGPGSGDDATMPVSDAGPDTMMMPTMDAMIDTRPFCEKHGADPGVVFCWDFENNKGQLFDGFTSSEIDPIIGNIVLTPDGGLLGSTGIVASLTDVPDGSSNQAFLALDVNDGGAETFDMYSVHEFSFAFAVRSNTLEVVAIGSVGLAMSGKPFYTGVGTYLQPDNMSTAVDVSSPPGNYAGSKYSTAYGTWYRAFIRLVRPDAGQQYAVTTSVMTLAGDEVDISQAENVDTSVKFDGGNVPPRIIIGTYFSSAPGSIVVAIDDVLYKEMR